MLCEKPLTTTLDEARRLHATVRSKNVPFVVAYTYTGFPMVMLARELVRDGAIGEVRKVEAWYPQGWLATKLEAEGQKQASWRVDPGKAAARAAAATSAPTPTSSSGSSPGLAAVRLRARLKTFVPGRALDDDFTVLAELDNGGIATITASQITIGAQNDNGFRVVGTTGTLEWSITDHQVLKHYAGGQPLRLYRQGAEYGYFPGSVKPYLRLPSGHPEGFHEALANLHRTLEWTIRGRRGEKVPTPFEHPGIVEGVAGMALVEAAVASSKQDGAWVEVPKIGEDRCRRAALEAAAVPGAAGSASEDSAR